MDAESMHTKGDSAPPSHIEEKAPDSPTPPASRDDVPVEPQKDTSHPQPSSPGVIVLQWLTYAFWGWLILGLIWLMSVILTNIVLRESVNDVVPYAIAASVVLLPLAFFCDLFYRKHEPAKKVGASMVIMVVHAVLFAVLGIISLIIAVFTGINALINIGEPLDQQMVVLTVTLAATVLYAGAFVRTLNPFKSKKPTLIYGVAMAGLTVVLLVVAIAGPVVSSLASRGDRLIERALPEVQSSVNSYIMKNNKLPGSLNDVSLNSDDAKDLVKDNKVEYKAVGKVAKTSLKEMFDNTSVYRYQLCVTYTAEKNGGESNTKADEDGYVSYISTYSHGAGRTCYNVEETVYEAADY